MTVTAVDNAVTDGFDRTEAAGWGSAPSGQAWTIFGGNGSGSVGSGVGVLSVSALPGNAYAVLDLETSATDIEMQFRTPVIPTGADRHIYLLACYDPIAFTWYALAVTITTGATLVTRIETGSPDFTVLAPNTVVPGITVVPGVWYRARFRVQGGRLAGKVWADGAPEPAS
ncbi:hypothetical protein ACFQ07_10560, partial [Actinomadura adrarensis]